MRSPGAWLQCDEANRPCQQHSSSTATGTVSCGIAGRSLSLSPLIRRLVGMMYSFSASLKGQCFPTKLMDVVMANSAVVTVGTLI